jgi:hypothetical protein
VTTPEPDQTLASALVAAERDLDSGRERWPATAALLAAVAVGISFLLPWRIGEPSTATLSYPGYGEHAALLVWWGLALATAVAGLWLVGRTRVLVAVLTSATAAVTWWLAVQAAGAEVVTDGGSLFSRSAGLSTGPGPALAVVGATVMLAAGLVPLVRVVMSRRSTGPEFTDYALRDAVRRLRGTRGDRPVDRPRLD